MSPEHKERIEEELFIAALDYEEDLHERISEEERAAMAEGDGHFGACSNSRASLRAFYRRTGENLYITCNMTVYYPGETHFDPDILAVRDVPLRNRDSYIVLKEGKGIDLAIEILNRGKRRKDLSDNVVRYARLGIPEYFVVDLRKGRIHAYRLAGPDSRRYAPLLGDCGRYHSAVLGLDLAFHKGELRFYSGTATVPLLEELAATAQETAAAAEAAAATAQETAAAAEEAAAAAQEQLRQGLGQSLLMILHVRGLPVSDEQREQVRTCRDVLLLHRWLARAATDPLDKLFLDS